MTDIKEHTLDATNERLGRLASRAAHILLGKDSTSFAKHVVAPVRVIIENVDNLDIPEKKRDEKVYRRYSGFHGGLKEETLEEVVEKKGTREVFSRAVYNMLPNNRLRTARMKNLIIK